MYIVIVLFFVATALGIARLIAILRRKRFLLPDESVLFIHPDLGIGGAERFVVDAAIGLNQQYQCRTGILTTSCDPRRSFTEVQDILQKDTGRRFPQVFVKGDFLPRSIRGGCVRLCKNFSMLYAVLWLVYFGPVYNAIIIDQLPAIIAVLQFLIGKNVKLIFYCHFPDHLCNPWGDMRSSLYTSIWRAAYTNLFDGIEKYFFLKAPCVLYNSLYTKSICDRHLGKHHTGRVLYPIMKLCNDLEISNQAHTSIRTEIPGFSQEDILILSISRFEPKKKILLALQTVENMLVDVPAFWKTGTSKNQKEIRLLLCGGYDDRLSDNIACMNELQEWLRDHPHVDKVVTIRTNISEDFKWQALRRADLVLYTPENEHFGIVPVEAMSCGKVVLASNSGGLRETIGPSGLYGVLVDANPRAFAQAAIELLKDQSRRQLIGSHSIERVRNIFSAEACITTLHNSLFG